MNPIPGEALSYRPILRAALAAADPTQAVHRALTCDGNSLLVQNHKYVLEALQNITIIGAGKAALAMGQAVKEILGDRVTGGLIVVPHGSTGSLDNLCVLQAGHPVPDRHGLRAAQACLKEARKGRRGDLVIVLLSGGASALLSAPAGKITLRDKRKVTEWLLKSGARIDEINIVRKHLSQIKGGWLAAEIHPASSLTLILSDVLSGNPSVIASGPTVPDPSCFRDAIPILKRYRIWTRLPESVQRYLAMGSRGRYPETPKPGSSVFEKARHCIVGNNHLAVEAALAQAQALGFQTMVLTTTLEGEAREIANVFGGIAREIHRSARPISRPACVLAGGELTVTIRGQGLGGRAQEFVLAAALEIEGLPQTSVVGFGTDGLDGPTEAAGAISNGMTVERARKIGLDPVSALSDNNSYGFFKALGDLILTGPTGTNVNDLYLLLMP